MKAEVMDMSDPQQLEEVLTAYYNLYSPDLQCIDHKTTPEESHLTDERVIVVVARNPQGEIVGVIMVDNDYVLFPVLAKPYVPVLRALIQKAYEANGGYLQAQTANRLIVRSAVAMGIKGVKSEGDRIWWGVK